MNKKQLIIIILAFVTIGVATVWVINAILGAGLSRLERFSSPYNREILSYHGHFNLDYSTTHIVFDGTRINVYPPPLVETRHGIPFVYLPAVFLQTYVDPFLFWDRSAEVFFASTRYDMLEFTPGQPSFLLNGEPRPLDTPIRRVDGEIFLPQDLVEGLYAITIEYAPEYSVVIVISALYSQTTGTVATRNAAVRFRPEIRAPIIVLLSQGDSVVIDPRSNAPLSRCSISPPTVAAVREVPDDFVRVRTPQGFIGYIGIDDLEDSRQHGNLYWRETILHTWIDNMSARAPRWHGGDINLVWEAAHNQTANTNRMEVPFHRSLTVVSPTWFELDAGSLSMTSVASQSYVGWAHDQGVYVWPKVFDRDNDTARAILLDRDARRTVIAQIVEYTARYNLDGINIDFEHLMVWNEGGYKIQFLRELSVALKDTDVVISAAVKIPHPSTRLYRRYLIGLSVDFVMVMAYDEHWSTSPVDGPVASLGWVNQAMENMLVEVPREQLLMGLPFYNRVWREVAATGERLPSRAWDMDYTRNFFESRGVEWEWDDNAGGYFGEVTVQVDGQDVIHRVWFENENSIAAKMRLFVNHELAGVAGWRRGFESAEIWDVLGHFF